MNNENLTFNQDDLIHFLLNKIIDLETDVALNKHLLNVVFLNLKPDEKKALDVLNNEACKLRPILREDVVQQLVASLKGHSKDMNDFLEGFLD